MTTLVPLRITTADTWAPPRPSRPSPGPRHRLRPSAEPPPPSRSSSPLPWPERYELLVPVLVAAAVCFWVSGFVDADPRAMTSFGLMSLFTPATVTALVVLTAAFALALRAGVRERVLAVPVVTLVALIHGTPVLLFGTLRYSWAWKHVGIVEFISRNGIADTSQVNLPVYQNWPGFFAGGAMLQELIGAPDVVGIAVWAPVAVNLVNLLVLRFLFRSLTADPRVIWTGTWVFFVVTWVGQDYFAPQALAFFLYLTLIALLLRAFRRDDPPVAPAAERIAVRRALPVVLVIIATIAWSHQITPLMTIILLTVLVVLRRIHGWYLPLIALGLTASWAFTIAYRYTVLNLSELFVNPTDSVGANLEKSEDLRGAQLLVSAGGRVVALLVAVVALVGIVRALRRRRLDTTALALLLAPGLLLLVTSFGGETVFRVFLFSAPFLAFFAACAVFVPGDPAPPRHAGTGQALAVVAMTALFLPGFLLAYYGKDQQNYFTPEEIAVADQVYGLAPPGSLLIEGTTNYPHSFRHYEHFRYVPIAGEEEADRDRLLADPAGVIREWVSDPRYSARYVVITRGQKLANDSAGPMPVGAVQRIEDALRASPDFAIYAGNRDAVVFVPVQERR